MLRRSAALTLLAAVLLGAGTAVETAGGQRMAIALPDGVPAASVILVPGGTTVEKIDDAGATNAFNNSVLRQRGALLAAGFAIACVEQPGDLRAAIARMRTVARPVFVFATSNGTIIALSNTARLGAAGPDGLVLTSPVTEYARRIGQGIGTINLGAVTAPVLIVYNTNDACRTAPPAGSAALGAKLTASTDVRPEHLTSTAAGTQTSSENALQCSPDSPHGFLGIDDQLAALIVPWLLTHARGR
jgi:hypothetical protein